jgi:anti-sigma regulatory factor (Ser/Thr protein kinase)
MRTGAAAGHPGYFHEAVRYDSDEHLLSVVIPFLCDGAEAGEPTIVAFGPRNAGLVRSALPAGSAVTFLGGDDVYSRPAGAIRSYRRLLAEHVAAGAGQIRIVGELFPEMFGATWDWWARYESAINHAYDEFPLWSMCAYDTRSTPAHVLAEVDRTHPLTAGPGGRHEPNESYTPPEEFLLEPRPSADDPIQAGPPVIELVDPSPGRARDAVRSVHNGQLPALDLENLVLAVSEAVTNAYKYGTAPSCMRVWTGESRTVVTVTDHGPGPKNPFAGLMPVASNASAGFGLWIAHQSCSHVSLHREDSGFTIRLVAGTPYTG